MYYHWFCVNIYHLSGSYLSGMMHGKYEYFDILQIMYTMQGDISRMIETVSLFNDVF